jgi:hypothetical protein
MRYNVSVPLGILPLAESFMHPQCAGSANISVRGLYFSSCCKFKLGTPLQITLRMPEEVAGGNAPEWKCRCRVVRSEARVGSSGVAGIAVEILYYEIVGPPQFRDLVPGLRTYCRSQDC